VTLENEGPDEGGIADGSDSGSSEIGSHSQQPEPEPVLSEESSAKSDLPHPRSTQPKKKGKKNKDAGRGIETMFRTAYRTHVELSALADTKANIMIPINGIIITILFASASDTVGSAPALLLPAAVLVLTCLGSLLFAILAARPRISSENVDVRDVRSGKRNILFFGNFVNIPEEEFVERILDLMSRRDDLYSSLARDLYSLGGVLSRKYQLIRTSYTVFMVGLTIGVCLFVIVLATGGLTSPPPFDP